MMSAQRSPLLSLDDALAQLLTQVMPLGQTESVATLEADGRYLAEAVVSELQVPAFDNSAMDGYALAHSDDLQLGACFRVTQRIKAGDDVSQGLPLPAGCAARIFTGAPILQGANTVVMQEDCDVSTLEEGEQIQLKSVPAKGQWIRRAGEDVNCGATVLVSGTRLSPAELGLAASVGMSKLCVAKQPRVALFSTGDELVMPGAVRPADMKPGSIFNSNRFFLKALLTRMGCVVTDLGVVPDRYDATVQALSDAALQHDLIVTSGGVSVGEEDHVKPAVQSLGRLHLWQISMKPGKPFAFGQIAQSYFVGLPGNPVSSFMTFLLLVRPLIQKLQGAPDPSKLAVQPTMMRADFEVGRADKRREFLRVKRNSAGGLDLFPNQSSGVLTSAVWGDGVVDKPAGQTIQRGDWVAYLPFSEFMR